MYIQLHNLKRSCVEDFSVCSAMFHTNNCQFSNTNTFEHFILNLQVFIKLNKQQNFSLVTFTHTVYTHRYKLMLLKVALTTHVPCLCACIICIQSK